jgi:hypothetical protein
MEERHRVPLEERLEGVAGDAEDGEVIDLGGQRLYIQLGRA